MGFSNFDDLLSNLEKTKKLSNKKNNSNKKGKDKSKKSSFSPVYDTPGIPIRYQY